MTKKIKICIMLAAAAIAVSGCSEKQVPSESVNNVVSLADEIAAGVSENVIPDEAYNFSKLFKKNEKIKDPSVITNDKAKWYKIPTKISMDELLSTEISNNEQQDLTDFDDKGGN